MEIVVPELGESIVEATVARWLKKEGDRVTVAEPVVELETDKVDVEVAAKADGVLTKIRHPEGDDVQVGDVLGEIEPADQPAPDGGPPAGEEEPEAAEEGAPAPTPEEAPPQREEMETPSAEAPRDGKGETEEEKTATPVARRIAETRGISVAQVPASGPGGRVTRQDVEQYLSEQVEKAPAPEEAPPREAAAPRAPERAQEVTPSKEGREERVRMSRRRRTIAARLVEAQQTAAILTTFNDVDMSAVMEMRSRWKEQFHEQYGVKLGFMSFFTKAVVGALRKFPQLNAEIDGDEIVLKHYYNIGIAIGAEEGLVVPVLKDADRMSFADIERAINEYVEKTRSGDLSIEDLRGGTFSITNGGVFGSLLSTPILNPPQVGILGLHRIEERPVAVKGEMAIRPMMYIALSYDHRVVDGREAVQFLGLIKELIEDPERMLLEG